MPAPRPTQTQTAVATLEAPSPRVTWVEREADPGQVSSLASGLKLPHALARVLVGRKVTDENAAGRFLEPTLRDLPDPARLAGIEAATARLVDALKRGETIGVFGDYDVDGVTSTTLLCEFLEACGATVAATVPDRLQEGYGLSRAGVDRLVDAGATLIVTVDCGVTAHEEVDYATSRGVDVVVIDHHTVPVTLPKAVSVLNPHRPDCTSNAHHLCAVGVTFNLCLALRRHLRETGFFSSSRPEPDLREGLDLVALGTVADVVPLIDDNRVMVDFGLKVIARGARPGMRALLDVAGVESHRLGAGHLGFQLGPRINAAGRLGDAMQAVQLLRTSDPKLATALAERLDRENLSRRDLERRIFEEAMDQVDRSAQLSTARALVVGSESWHPGVVGIVASRLVERYGRPTVVVGEGGRGSGRSIPSFNLYDALRAVESTLAGFGGHAHAAGVRVPDGGLDTFRDALLDEAASTLAEDDLGRTFVYDGTIDLADVTPTLVEDLQKAAPYGRKNPEPLFRFNGLLPRGVRELKGGHLKGIVSERPRIEAIFFGASERIDAFTGAVDVLAVPELNLWRGSQTLQLRLKDFAPAGARSDGGRA